MMKYIILCPINYMYAVSKEHLATGKPAYLLRTNEVVKELNTTSHYMSDPTGIVATNDHSLNLPLLPAVEEDAERLADKYVRDFMSSNKISQGFTSLGINRKNAFLAGYKAASAKQFTEEDMKDLLYLKRQLYSTTDAGVLRKFIEARKPKPVAVELEMLPIGPNGNIIGTNLSEPYDGLKSNFVLVPRVDENNSVKVKQWYYS